MFRHSLHITLVPLCLLDDVFLGCSSSSAGLLLSQVLQPRATGESESITFCGYGSAPTLHRLGLSCCGVAGFPAMVVRDGLHKHTGISPAKHLRDLCCPVQCPCPSWDCGWKATLERYYWVEKGAMIIR